MIIPDIPAFYPNDGANPRFIVIREPEGKKLYIRAADIKTIRPLEIAEHEAAFTQIRLFSQPMFPVFCIDTAEEILQQINK